MLTSICAQCYHCDNVNFRQSLICICAGLKCHYDTQLRLCDAGRRQEPEWLQKKPDCCNCRQNDNPDKIYEFALENNCLWYCPCSRTLYFVRSRACTVFLYKGQLPVGQRGTEQSITRARSMSWHHTAKCRLLQKPHPSRYKTFV